MMTKKEQSDFEQMYIYLQRIAKGYKSLKQIDRDTRTGPLLYEEYLGMAYENIKQEAKDGLRGIRRPKETTFITPSSGPPLGSTKKGLR